MRPPVSFYLAEHYPYTVVPEPEGGFFVSFPDLPGCMTQVEDPTEIATMAEEVRALWIESAYDQDSDIPLPSGPAEYSGKFLVRIPRSLHRSLAEASAQDGVSLNHYVATLLARGDAQAGVERRVVALERTIEALAGRRTASPESPSLDRLDPTAA